MSAAYIHDTHLIRYELDIEKIYMQMKINRLITKNIFLFTISWAYYKLEAELIAMCSVINIQSSKAANYKLILEMGHIYSYV